MQVSRKSRIQRAFAAVCSGLIAVACGSSEESGKSDAGAAGHSTNGASGAAAGPTGMSTGGNKSTATAGSNGSAGATANAGASGSGSSGRGSSDELDKFSFFVTSLKALQELSNSDKGFGGDLRFGETGAGAGLRGADKICTAIAERSMPGSGAKDWHAFLSASADENGRQVNAIDRIGAGPWYDRLGRVLAMNKADLMHDRPTGADTVIANDFPNEDGVPNHRPDPSQPEVDNHDTLTGTNAQGQLYSATATCKDWTSAVGDPASEGKPRVGHAWPRSGPGGGGPGGGGAGGRGGGMMGGGSGGGAMNSANWMSALDEAGCGPSVNLVEMGGPQANNPTVGSGGGYGAFYCFAATP